MIGAMRTKMGPKIIGGVIAVITCVFVFYGIFTPGSGSQAPSVAGEVNGETITYTEFSRALNQRVEFFRNMMGGKMTDEQMEQFHIREAVFQDLAQRKVLSQMARKEGFYPSAEQIRDQIVKMDAFKKDGHFDKVQYKNVLNANQYSPTRFEELVGQDIMEQNFRGFISSLAHVSPDDVERELKASKERRKIKYVYVDNESARKLLPKDLKADEQNKKLDEKMDSLSKEILPALTSNADGKISGLLKEVKITAKTSDWLTGDASVIPGVGNIGSVSGEIKTMKKGDPAKKLALIGGTLFAKVVDEEGYDPAKVTAKERNDLEAKLQGQKQSELLSEFIQASMKKASVTRNDRVVVSGQGAHVPVTPDQ